MNRIKSFIAISAFSLLVLGLPAVASAQWRNDPYGNNGRYSNGNLRSAVQDLKNRARDFERMTNNNNRYNNNRGYNGSVENLADQFKKAADRLESRFGNGRNLDNSYDEAQRVLSIASQIDNELSYNSRGNNRRGGWGNTGYGGYGGGYGGSNVQGAWSGMRYDLQIIADAYNYNNRGNRNRNGNYRIGNLPWPF